MKRWGWWLVGGLVFVYLWQEGTTMLIQKIARAIAFAEGFFTEGSRPQRNHNPGDLTEDLTGRGIGKDGPFVKYENDEDGWAALEKLVGMMFEGSHIYQPSMTLLEIASHYTATDSLAWAENVAAALGVSPTTRLSEIRS